MKPEAISGTTARSGQPTPIRQRAEDNDRFVAPRSEAVAFALGRISDPAISLFGRVKVAGDESDSGPIERKLLLKVCDEHGKEWIPRWTGKGRKPMTHKADTIRNLVRIALFEELYGCVCPVCRGRRWNRRVVAMCERCKGRGISPWNDSDRAAMLDMNYSQFMKTWARRVGTIKSYMGEYTELIERVRI